MTLTSTGPSGFHLKPLVAVFAATVFAFAAVAVGLWVGNESQPSMPATVDAATPVATPEVAPSANWAAFEAGKLDDGPPSLPSAAVGESGAQAVAGTAPNTNFDAYSSGKFDLELAAVNPGRYAASGAGHTSANWAAYEGGKLDDTRAIQPVTVDVSSGNYAPLVAGKYDLEYAGQHRGVTYVQAPEIADGTSATWAAYEAGKLDDTPTESEGAIRAPAVSGGHQEF
jgi:hypothetical protein